MNNWLNKYAILKDVVKMELLSVIYTYVVQRILAAAFQYAKNTAQSVDVGLVLTIMAGRIKYA